MDSSFTWIDRGRNQIDGAAGLGARPGLREVLEDARLGDSAFDETAPPALPGFFVIPAFNERENLPRLLEDLEDRPHLWPLGSRVIIVDDGSSDGTAELVEDYEGPLPLELVRMGSNQGPGAAFRAGFAAALRSCPGDGFVITLEADTTSDLDVLPEMLKRSEAGAELVLASVHGGGHMVNVNPLRRVLSKGAGLAVRRGLGLDAHTVSSFFRVYRVSLLRRAVDAHGDGLITEAGFACKAELLAKLVALGARVDEVPVDLDASRRVGKSKMRILPTLLGYWRIIALQRATRSGRVHVPEHVAAPEDQPIAAWAEDDPAPA
ncbi:MAG: glycosyltransferase [Gaiellaceae bacterium]